MIFKSSLIKYAVQFFFFYFMKIDEEVDVTLTLNSDLFNIKKLND